MEYGLEIGMEEVMEANYIGKYLPQARTRILDLNMITMRLLSM